MIGPTCPACGHIHASTDVRAEGRFRAGLAPLTYRAIYPGAPARTTRDEAMRDMCQHRQEQR